ncbi:MAG: SpoIIE family protein phosphatase [Desulfobacteraceae bacterium]|jgi:PAS domain S-box-containing protein|nr:SpoIIE family protein phosphatase [Desulfobacteraceae bacterium]
MDAETSSNAFPLRVTDENAALRRIFEGTATSTGAKFFEALVENLSRALRTRSAWMSEYDRKRGKLKVLAMCSEGRPVPGFVMDVSGTPCQAVVENGRLVHYDDNIAEIFPEDTDLKSIGAVSYMGAPLLDTDGSVMGNLAVLDTRPMPRETRAEEVIHIFAGRAAAELQRLRAEQRVLKSEEKYRRIVETTDEGFLLLDAAFGITDANAAFCRMVGLPREKVIGRTPLDFTTAEYREFLKANRNGILSGVFKGIEGILSSADGRQIPVLIYGSGLNDDRGHSMGTMVFVIDITPQKRALTLAGEVQRALLPQNGIHRNGFQIEGRTLNCDEIGGDYFDFIEDTRCADGSVSVAVGDVSGHGVEAALLMAAARASLRMRSQQCETGRQIVEGMNRQLTRDVQDTGRFMTLFYIRLDTHNDVLSWIRAGHPPALLYDPDEDRFRNLQGDGLALGIDEHRRYEEQQTEGLRQGQVVAVGTDGIWEAVNLEGESYGMDRFRKVLRRYAEESAATILDAVFADVAEFTRGRHREDDITLVVIKATEKPKAPFDFQI